MAHLVAATLRRRLETKAMRDSSEGSTSHAAMPPKKRLRVDRCESSMPHSADVIAKPATSSAVCQDTSESLLESLPTELFCQVLSFIGPTSSSLLRLCEVNQYMRGTMGAIGKAMLPRAQSHFQVPLKPMADNESFTSLFVRHARTCSTVLAEITQLRSLLSQNHSSISIKDVQKAMDIALNLLELGPTLSISLERQILATCGKCGGKAFKYSKWMLLHNLSAPPEDVSPETLLRRQEEYAQNQERLDLSRLIMQMVVFRDLQLSKQSPKVSPAKDANMKQIPSMGCF